MINRNNLPHAKGDSKENVCNDPEKSFQKFVRGLTGLPGGSEGRRQTSESTGAYFWKHTTGVNNKMNSRSLHKKLNGSDTKLRQVSRFRSETGALVDGAGGVQGAGSITGPLNAMTPEPQNSWTHRLRGEVSRSVPPGWAGPDVGHVA